MGTIPYSKRIVPAPLFVELVELDAAVPLAVGEPVCDPVKSTERFETGNDCVVSVSVIPLPFTQRLEVPGALAVNLIPAHYGKPASLAGDT
jgi:hypothetical protein